MTLRGYFLQCVDSHGGISDLVHQYPGVDRKLIECYKVDYSEYDTDTHDSRVMTAFMFNMEGFFHWNGYSLVPITDVEGIRECQTILNNLGKDYIVED